MLGHDFLEARVLVDEVVLKEVIAAREDALCAKVGIKRDFILLRQDQAVEPFLAVKEPSFAIILEISILKVFDKIFAQSLPLKLLQFLIQLFLDVKLLILRIIKVWGSRNAFGIVIA